MQKNCIIFFSFSFPPFEIRFQLSQSFCWRRMRSGQYIMKRSICHICLKCDFLEIAFIIRKLLFYIVDIFHSPSLSEIKYKRPVKNIQYIFWKYSWYFPKRELLFSTSAGRTVWLDTISSLNRCKHPADIPTPIVDGLTRSESRIKQEGERLPSVRRAKKSAIYAK